MGVERSLRARVLAAANPPSLAPARTPAIFDNRPHRNKHLTPAPPSTAEMMNQAIAMCVEFGMPRQLAEEARINPYEPRHAVYFLAGLIMGAAEGDVRSLSALDRVREGLVNAGAVGEVFGANEQVADSAELQTLMGVGD